MVEPQETTPTSGFSRHTSPWRRVASCALLLGAVGAQAPVDPTGAEAREPGRHAVLVGVEDYDERLGWKRLRGARADAEVLRETLVTRAGFPAENVRLLLDEQATHNAILGAFRDMIDAAQEGDVLLFAFAGHGSRLPDASGDEPDGLDETLIPYDAALPDGRPNDVLDDEIQALIALANEKTEQVVLVFDCCSAGTNTRGGEFATRFVSAEQRGFAGTRAGAGAAPSVVPDAGSGYTQGDLHYVSLAACRSMQSAHEFRPQEPDAGQEDSEDVRVHGLFTWCLVRELGDLRGELTYADLLARVRRSVSALKPNQTPVIEGPLANHGLFGGVRPAEPTWDLEVREEGTLLLAGRQHSLETRAVVEVRDGDAVVGRARLGQVGLTEAVAEWIDAPPGPGKYRAVLTERGRFPHRLGFTIEADDAGVAGRAALTEVLVETGELRDTWRSSAHLVLRSDGERWRVFDARGADEFELPLSAALDDEPEIRALARGLRRLGVAKRVADTLCNESSPDLQIRASIELIDEGGRPIGTPAVDETGRPVLRVGQTFGFRLDNRSTTAVYASLLLIAADGTIEVMWQSPSPDDPIAPGGQVATGDHELWDACIPEESAAFYANGIDRYRWVVSSDHIDLARLEQPAAVGSTRGGSDAQVPDERPIRSWVTCDLEVRVEQKP